MDGLLQKRDSYDIVAHGTSLLLGLLWIDEPFHDAVVMEQVSTGGDFTHICTIHKWFHADHTVSRPKLIDILVILSILEQWNQPLEVFNCLFVSPPSLSFSIHSRLSSLLLSSLGAKSTCL